MRQLKGTYFRRQHPYSIYTLDFYYFQVGLVLELNGEVHQYREDYDTERTEFLGSTGLKVIKFDNDDFLERNDRVIEEILKHF